MNDAIGIRFATLADAEAIRAVMIEAAEFQRSLNAPLWDAETISPAYVSTLVGADEAVVAEAGGAIVGAMALQWRDEMFWPDRDDDLAGYLHRIAVRRDFAGAQVTTPLMGFAAEEARRRGKRFLRLDCVPRPRLMAVYERFGFREVDTRLIPALGADFRVVRFEKPLN